jgi:hypothetical protein
MNRFLVIGFEFCKSFYYSLILCKAKSDGTEYRITVMHGDIEKQLCNNNTIKEINGCLQIERSGNKLQDQIKIKIAEALGKMIGKPVKEIEKLGERPGERLQTDNLLTAQTSKTISENRESE